MAIHSYVLRVSGLHERESIVIESEFPDVASEGFRHGRTELGDYLDGVEAYNGAQVLSVSVVSPTSVLVTVRIPDK